MGFLKKLSKIISSPDDKNVYWVYVRCNRCGERLHSRVNLWNDLSIEYGDGEGMDSYYCRKVLMGGGHCFQKIEVSLAFDKDFQVIDQQIQGGQFISEQDYEKMDSSVDS